MPKVMQNLVVLRNPNKKDWQTSFKGGRMCFNRFSINEDAAFELSGVYNLKGVHYSNVAKGYFNFIRKSGGPW